MNRKRLAISLTVGLVISGVAFYFAFRKIPFRDLGHYLISVNYWWIVPSALVAMGSFFLRVFRWQIILGSVKGLGVWKAFHPMMIGFMLNCLLPGRMGEMARPAILRRKEGLSFFRVLATVAAERVFDVMTILMLFTFVLATVPIDPTTETSFGPYRLNRAALEAVAGGMVRAAALLLLGMAVVSFTWSRNLLGDLILGAPRVLFALSVRTRQRMRDRCCMPVVRTLERFAQGFSQLKSPSRMGQCWMLSLGVWVSAGLSYYLMSLGCPGVGLSLWELIAVMVIICFFIALPSAPGFWGLWEAGGVFALSLFGVPAKEAAGFTLVNHVIQMVPVILVGLVSAAITGVDLWQISSFDDRSVEAMGEPMTVRDDLRFSKG